MTFLRKAGKRAFVVAALAAIGSLLLSVGVTNAEAPPPVVATAFEEDIARGPTTEGDRLRFAWKGRKKYPKFNDDPLSPDFQPCWHVQSVERLQDKTIRVEIAEQQLPTWTAGYFVWMSSNGWGGLLHIGRTDPGIVDENGRIRGREGDDGEIVWHWSMQPDDAGATLPGTSTEVGRWNHPSKADTLGNFLAIAMQDWATLDLDPEGLTKYGECLRKHTGQADAVVWLDVEKPEQPQFKSRWRGSELGHPEGNAMEITNVAALSVPHRAGGKIVVLISIGGRHGNMLGVAVDPSDVTDVNNYRWHRSAKKVSEWYYGRRISAQSAFLVHEVHDPSSRAVSDSVLMFEDSQGSRSYLPDENTVDVVRKSDTTVRMNTYSDHVPSCGRASGIFVDARQGSGRSNLLCGQVDHQHRARIWFRQRRPHLP